MEAQKIKLLSLLGEAKKTFNIPVYQRNYDWKKEHCKRLFQDIEKIALSNFETEHFLGVIVCVASQSYMNYNEWILIDGQQRITSVTLFLIALGKIIGGTIEEDIIESYIINKRASEKLRIKLKPIESDSVTYLSILENDEDVIDKESNIYLNYMYFKELIKHSRVKPQRLYEALTKIELVCISLEKDKKSENPQVIFESLNSTGLSLTQADLIRNFLLMNHCYDEQTDLYKKYWLKMEMLITNKKISDFIRDFLTMKTSKISNKEKVYEEFKAYVIENNFDEKVILKELLTFATYYSYFIHYNHSKTEINQLLEEISLLKSTTVYPFLLYIFNERDKETLEDLEVIKSLKILITYIYRRQVCDYRTNALNKIFANLSNDLKSNNSGEKFVERLLQVLAAKTSSGTFPRDEEFKERFIYKNMYNTSIDKYTLVKIENYNSKENVEISNSITIEHVMPQKLTPQWQIELGKKFENIHSKYLHTIGNLTLSGYNSELSNNSFASKKEIFIESNINMSRNICEFNEWNETTIVQRATNMFETALKLWEFPKKYQSKETVGIDYSTPYLITTDIKVTGEKPRLLIIDDIEHTVSSWKDVLRILCKELYDLDNIKLQNLIDHSDFKGREKSIIDKSKANMLSPYKIDNNLYIETNLSALDILNYCKLLCLHYGLDNDVYFMLKRH